MKKVLLYAAAFVFAGTLTLSGNSYAGLFDSDDEPETRSPSATVEEPMAPPAASEEAMPAGEEITLSGTIDVNNNFVADNGESYALSDSDKSDELKALSGQKIEITGTVLEEEGRRTVEVTDYEILE